MDFMRATKFIKSGAVPGKDGLTSKHMQYCTDLVSPHAVKIFNCTKASLLPTLSVLTVFHPAFQRKNGTSPTFHIASDLFQILLKKDV